MQSRVPLAGVFIVLLLFSSLPPAVPPKDYAAEMTASDTCSKMEHSNGSGYGENLYLCEGTTSCYSAKRAMVRWCEYIAPIGTRRVELRTAYNPMPRGSEEATHYDTRLPLISSWISLSLRRTAVSLAPACATRAASTQQYSAPRAYTMP